jgi:hypothetical protein
MVLSMNRLFTHRRSASRAAVVAALLLIPAVGLWAAPPARITKELINEKPPKAPQETCFAPGAVEYFSYRNNNLRITTEDARTYDVSFFVQCGGLRSTESVKFDGTMNNEVCGTGIESVVFYSKDLGPKRCAIKDVSRTPMMSRTGR